MRIILAFVLGFFSINCFSQTIDNFKYYPNPFTKKIDIYFKVKIEDTITFQIIDLRGEIRNSLLSNNILKIGTYKIDYIANSLDKGVYIAMIKQKDKKFMFKIVKTSPIDKSNQIDTTQIFFTDSIKVNDTIRFLPYDTAKIVIKDINILSSINDFRGHKVSESIVVNDFLNIMDSNVNYIEIYDMSGINLLKTRIYNSDISLQSLKTGVYIGLYYHDSKIINAKKILKK